MNIDIINQDRLMIRLTCPKLLLRRKSDFGDIECGPYLTDTDTGIYYSRYDYGHAFKLQLLGVGIDVWWL
jgi:hypothetical protein